MAIDTISTLLHEKQLKIIFSILLSADAEPYFGSVVFDSTRKAPSESLWQHAQQSIGAFEQRPKMDESE
jgi:hypothetical protein